MSATTPRIRAERSVGRSINGSSNWSARRSLSIRSTVPASRFPAAWIRSSQAAWAGVALPCGIIFQRSVIPRITATGVFSSWLATSMNAFFRELDCSSLWFVSVSSAISLRRSTRSR